MMKGKVLGSIDLGLSFIHTDAATRRIDIDGEHQVMHLKVTDCTSGAYGAVQELMLQPTSRGENEID